MLNYKGYVGVILDINIDTGYFFGMVKYIEDVITFQGRTVEELVNEFQVSVDDYLEFCEGLKQNPKRTQLFSSDKELISYTEEFNSNVSDFDNN
jgi:predicted HicB family RNase H-like nuclease